MGLSRSCVLYLVWVCVQVDILSKLPKTEFNQKLAATKWSEILEGLNIAVDMIGDIPKLTPGDYGDLVQKVKRLGDHSHVQVRRGVSFAPASDYSSSYMRAMGYCQGKNTRAEIYQETRASSP